MTELDQVWSKMLIDAGENADRVGRREIAEYLRLKATNDAIRSAGVAWLLDTVIDLAGSEMRHRSQLIVEREAPFSFMTGNSRMVGALVSVRLGVRCLTIEAGWARIPSDGIMRGGSLAAGRISHFGRPRDTTDIRLVHDGPLPRWVDEDSHTIDRAVLNGHLELLF